MRPYMVIIGDFGGRILAKGGRIEGCGSINGNNRGFRGRILAKGSRIEGYTSIYGNFMGSRVSYHGKGPYNLGLFLHLW